MYIKKTSQVFFIILVFFGLGIMTLLFTHDSGEFKLVDDNLPPLVAGEDYVDQVRPWLNAVIDNYSSATVAETRTKLLNLRSNDRAIGQVHINLFLAFESWQKFLNTEDNVFRQNTISSLGSISVMLPELKLEIDSLVNILLQ